MTLGLQCMFVFGLAFVFFVFVYVVYDHTCIRVITNAYVVSYAFMNMFINIYIYVYIYINIYIYIYIYTYIYIYIYVCFLVCLYDVRFLVSIYFWCFNLSTPKKGILGHSSHRSAWGNFGWKPDIKVCIKKHWKWAHNIFEALFRDDVGVVARLQLGSFFSFLFMC